MQRVGLKWLLTALAMVPMLASAATVSGQVSLTERKKPVRQAQDVVVYYRPDQPVAPQAPAEPYIMVTYRKRFDPRVLAVPVGSKIQFPNRDPILHNAFSVSGDNQFDVGLYGEGEGSTVSLESTGLVRVFCNVHQSMVGHILVLDTPFFAKASADGSFRLEDVPEGSGKLYVWHERARRPQVVQLEVPTTKPLSLDLSLDKRRVPSHKNKHGKTYRDARRRY